MNAVHIRHIQYPGRIEWVRHAFRIVTTRSTTSRRCIVAFQGSARIVITCVSYVSINNNKDCRDCTNGVTLVLRSRQELASIIGITCANRSFLLVFRVDSDHAPLRVMPKRCHRYAERHHCGCHHIRTQQVDEMLTATVCSLRCRRQPSRIQNHKNHNPHVVLLAWVNVSSTRMDIMGTHVISRSLR